MTDPPFYFTWDRQPDVPPFPVVRAEQDEFVLADGRRIYDFISTSFQANFGHSNRVIGERIRQQLDVMPIASPKATFELKNRVSEQLIERLGLAGGRLFFTVSGSESVENALKMARQVRGRTVVLARQKSYHGATLGALSVTGDWRGDAHFTVHDQTVRIPEPDEDPDLSRTRKIIAETGSGRIAAVILETISGTNGVVVPPEQWVAGLNAICREHQLLLIVDEVLCGFGRTGPDFAFQRYPIEPDFVCMSKAITGGYIPFGAVWTGPRVVGFYKTETMACGLTNYAHPLGLAALSGVMEVMADAGFQQNKRELEATFAAGLGTLEACPAVRAVRRSGMLAAIDWAGPTVLDWKTCFSRGLHLYARGAMAVLAPPLISQPERLAAALEVLTQIAQDKE